MTRLTGGEAVVQSLVQNGLNTIYGLPGVQNDYFYNALYDQGDKVRVIHTRHEQGAAYMALGATMATGEISVANIVPGPGALNASAALATAHALNARVLTVVGQIPQHQMGRNLGVLHEIPNQEAILGQFAKHYSRISTPSEAPYKVNQAIAELMSGRPRPATIEVPMDVLQKKEFVDFSVDPHPVYQPPLDEECIEAAAKIVGNAKKPMIFVGSGAQDVSESVKRLAEALEAPVVGYRTGRGILDSRHYLSFMLPEAKPFWEDCDVAIVLGTSGRVQLNKWGRKTGRQIVRFDIDPNAQASHGTPDVLVAGALQESLPLFLEQLSKYNGARTSRESEMQELHQTWTERSSVLSPQVEFLQEIREALGEDGIFVDELTQVGFASRIVMPMYKPRTFISTGYMGTLGYGFPTALGAKSACPDKRVVSVTGDGGFMFAASELATAVMHGINLVTVLFNNNQYGNVQQMQKQLYDGRVIASNLKNPDFEQFVGSFGASYFRADDQNGLGKALDAAFNAGSPAVVEVPVSDMPSVDQFR